MALEMTSSPAPSLDVILQQGLVGAFCVLSIFVSWQLFKMYVQSQESKISILKEALEVTKPLADAVKELTNSHRLLAEKIQRLEDVGRK